MLQYQESETNSSANPDVRNKTNNILGFLAMPKTKYPCCQMHILPFLHLAYTSSLLTVSEHSASIVVIMKKRNS